MIVEVKFDDRVKALAGGAPGAEVGGSTVQTALFEVAKAFPSLHMFNCEGEMRSAFRISRNGQPAELSEPIAEGDEMHLYVG